MYETGKQTPRPETVERIPALLRLPRQYFFSEPSWSEPERPIYYRSMSAATKVSRRRAENRFWWLKEAVNYITQFVEIPAVRIPELAPVSDPRELLTQDIEAAARVLRGEWGLSDGPISDVVLLLENHGVVVSRMALHSERLDAFSEWSARGRPYIVLGSDKESAVRSRFDAAHELGHLVLHRRVGDAALRRTETFALMERQAHRFAAEFLMPASSFAQEVQWPSVEAFLAMKARWKVAISAMVHRSEEIGLITEQTARRFYISIARRGWKRQEPMDDQLQPESPRVLRRAFELVVRERVQSVEQIQLALPYEVDDLAEMLALPIAFFGRAEPEVKLLNLPARPRATPDLPPRHTGRVIRFPSHNDEERG